MAAQSIDTFHTVSSLEVGSNRYRIYRLDALAKGGPRCRWTGCRSRSRSCWRTCSGARTTGTCRRTTSGRWRAGTRERSRKRRSPSCRRGSCCRTSPGSPPSWTWRPCAKASGDWAATRSASIRCSRVDLVIDHSVQVDHFGSLDSFASNSKIEYERNQERYAFLRWGQNAFDNFSVVPPDTGIVHQVNLEFLGKVVFTAQSNGDTLAYPDTLVGADSHTPMINGLGVVGWGVGGIEAEAAMLGQPLIMLIPEVIGFKLHGRLPEGRHRNRPGAHHRADAQGQGRGGEVRGVLWAGAVEPGAGRPGYHRQHGAGVTAPPWASSRWTTRPWST